MLPGLDQTEDDREDDLELDLDMECTCCLPRRIIDSSALLLLFTVSIVGDAVVEPSGVVEETGVMNCGA